MEQAYFFFGDDVENYLEQLWKDIVTVRAANQVLGGTPGARKPSSRPRASLRSRQNSKNGARAAILDKRRLLGELRSGAVGPFGLMPKSSQRSTLQ